MFEDRRKPNSVRLILPHIEPRPIQLLKRRPHTVPPFEHKRVLTPLEKLKLLRKLKRTSDYFVYIQ